MRHPQFWRYLRSAMFVLVAVSLIGNITLQLFFRPQTSLIRTGDSLPIVVIGICVALLAIIAVPVFREENSKAKKGIARISKLALARGYPEQNLIPLAYAVSPLSKSVTSRATGTPILAWDESRIELLVPLTTETGLQSLLSAELANTQISLEQIQLGNRLGPVRWGFHLMLRQITPSNPEILQAWKFVPLGRNNRLMRKAEVSELIARLAGSLRPEQLPTP